MLNNSFQPADNAVPTVRTLPWLSSPFSGGQPMPARSRAQAPAPARVHATAMPAVVGYRVSGVDISGRCVRITTGQTASVVGTGTDHKFSTRLGPSASPPV